VFWLDWGEAENWLQGKRVAAAVVQALLHWSAGVSKLQAVTVPSPQCTCTHHWRLAAHPAYGYNTLAPPLPRLCRMHLQVTAAEGFGKARLFEILDDLEEKTRPIMTEAKARLAKEKGESALEPHNIGYALAGLCCVAGAGVLRVCVCVCRRVGTRGVCIVVSIHQCCATCSFACCCLNFDIHPSWSLTGVLCYAVPPAPLHR
jgi:hypothetical protein